MFHSHSRQFFLINIRFAGCIGDWQEIIAKWSCLWALCTVSWQKRRFTGNSSAVTTKQAGAKSFLNLRRDTAQMQTAVMTVIKAYQQAELHRGAFIFIFFIHPNQSRYVILFGTLIPQLALFWGILKELSFHPLHWCWRWNPPPSCVTQTHWVEKWLDKL